MGTSFIRICESARGSSARRGSGTLRLALLCVLPALACALPALAQSRCTPPPHGAAPACGVHCGTEGWPVKTMSDSDASRVNLLDTLRYTVGDMRALARPKALAMSRRSSAERHVYRVHADLLAWTQEADSDLHLVIATHGHTRTTMIAEVPDSLCEGVCSSRVHGDIASARRAVVAALGHPPKSSFHAFTPPKQVVITGIAFFDCVHGGSGQRGHAPTNIELHPVLRIDFGP